MNSWDQDLLSALVDRIVSRDNKCMLFIGAGLSRQLGYPDWFNMLKQITELALQSPHFQNETKSRIKNAVEMKDRYLLFNETDEVYRHCEGQYLDLLKRLFSPKNEQKFTNIHTDIVFILNKYLKGIITTNFDLCLEFACKAVDYEDVISETKMEKFTNTKTKSILHIHGNILDPSSCIVCPFQYAGLYTPSFSEKLETLLTNNTIIYLGTSLDDFEILRILERRASVCLINNKTKFPDIKEHYAICPIRDNVNPLEEKDYRYNHFKIHVQHYDIQSEEIRNGAEVRNNHQMLCNLIEELKAECEKRIIRIPITKTDVPLDKVAK